MFEAIRLRRNRKRYAIVMDGAGASHGHPRRWQCELRFGELELRPNSLDVKDRPPGSGWIVRQDPWTG
jgi:hypothetical protein